MQNGDGENFYITEERAIPDIYSDSVRFHLTAYGVTLEFGQSAKPAPKDKNAPPHIPRLRVNMSPQHAKVMALLLARGMREYETQIGGKLPLPKALLDQFNLQEEW